MRRFLVLIVVMACGDRGIGTNERAWLLTMRPVWIAAAKAERCPRPALRTPATGDGSALLRVLNDPRSAEERCLDRVHALREELGPCLGNEPCKQQPLSAVQTHADVVEACAPLYREIEEIAHSSEACSPTPAMTWNEQLDVVANFGTLGNAVRLEVAPLVREGRLGEAATRVLDAIRFADDYGRSSVMIGAMMSNLAVSRLVDVLDEIAIDPRLTNVEASAIARDLDVLLASAPRWDAILRQEQAGAANLIASRPDDMVPELAILAAQAPGLQRVCSGTLRDCVKHLDEVHVEGGMDFKPYGQRFAMRDYGLAFVRMQIALRLADPASCSDPARRRAVLQPWADQVDVGDECDPVVAPPAWQRGTDYIPRPVPRTLHCVAAAP